MKNKILLLLIFVISITLCIPSIIYLINNKTVNGFNAYYTFTLIKSENYTTNILSGILVISLLLIFGIIYLYIIKKEKKIFKDRKQIMIFIATISFIFTMILPYLSSDIYYYIGDSWLAAKYGENPYYTSVNDLQEQGINDEILQMTGEWKDTTSIYGPLWNYMATFLVSFSFGSITLALFIFKIVAYLIHILNSYLIYKITKSNKYMLLYGLNPLVLMEFLSNVHNDIYLVFLTLLSIYFLVRKKNIILTILALALSVSLKYSTALFVPFILIYCFRNQSLYKKILYCLISGITIIVFVVFMYLPCYRDITIFTNMLVQGTKYTQSVLLFFIYILSLDLSGVVIGIFLSLYAILIYKILNTRRKNIYYVIRKYNDIMLIFIFIVLSTFQRWYILWLFPTLIWQKRNMRNFIIYMTMIAMVPSFKYFIVQSDNFTICIFYSVIIILLAISLLGVDLIKNKYKKETQCQN